MTSFDDLEKQILNARSVDRHRFTGRLRGLQSAAKSGKPFDRKFTQLQNEIEASVNLRIQRLDRLPRPVFEESLPVCLRRDEIATAIRESQVVIVCGETGSGKSTQLPKICLDLQRGVDGLIGHTQPRRIAARSIAGRIADELNSSVGGTVGYKIRFADQVGQNTYVKLMTDGILLAETQKDRFLNQYDTIIIDEAHERSLNIDFLIGYLRQLLPRRPDLKLIITSATIDAERFAEHFATTLSPAPIIHVSGRTFPVELRYRPTVVEDGEDEPDWERAIVGAIREVAEIDTGDILVFLPAEREIMALAKILRGTKLPHDHPGRQTEILPLYARLPTSEQNRVFAPHSHRRIVLATNVAESSLTVPGIRYVIDPGTARISRYSARSKMQRLPIEAISQASADQRKGRCGRVGPGVCIRLYSEADFLGRERFTAPEVQRTSLASVILQLKAFEFGEIDDFPFLDPPKSEAIRDGYKTLFELGALDENNALTPLGRQISRVPADPRVARIILAGDAEGCLSEVLIIAAVLELQDPRERPFDKQQAADACHAVFQDEDSDFLSYLKVWDFFEELRQKLSRSQLRKACQQNFLSYNRMVEWQDVHRQLLDLVSEFGLKPQKRRNDSQAIHRALLTGFLSNIALKGDGSEYTVGGGGKTSLWPGSGLIERKPKWIVCAEQIETSRRYLRTCGKIDPGWIERLAPHLVKRSYSDPAWNRERASVSAFEKVTLSGLPIVTRRPVNYGPIEPVLCRELFIRHALVLGEYTTSGQFAKKNNEAILELTRLETKARQTGLLKDEEAQIAFYEQRIPAHVYDGPRFEKWRKTIERDQPDFLVMKPEDLVLDHSLLPQPQEYPDQVALQSMQLPIQYRFEPGEEHDGVTITLPMQALNQLDTHRLGWLVPGLLQEKVLAMIKSLPKDARRHFVPANETAQAVTSKLSFGQGDLATQLAELLSHHGGVAVEPEMFNLSQLPDHLRFNVCVVDDSGKKLAAGRDIRQLREQLGSQASESFTRIATSDQRWQRDQLTTWNFGELPIEVTVSRNHLTMKGYPALVDQGDTIAIRLFDSETRAANESHHGLRRLFAIAHAREIKNQVSHLPDLDRQLLLGTTIQQANTFRSSLGDLLAERAMALAMPAGGKCRPVNESECTQLFRLAKGKLGLAVQDLIELMNPLMIAQRDAKQLLKVLGVTPTIQSVVRDIKTQIDALTPAGYLARTPWAWLQQYPRYFRAIAVRLNKIKSGGLPKDLKAMERLAPFLRDFSLRSQQHASRSLVDPQLQQFRWLVEEFRVSLFAQELKTVVPISEKRLEELWRTVSP